MDRLGQLTVQDAKAKLLSFYVFEGCKKLHS